MAVGELVVSVFPDYTMLEMFTVKGSKKKLMHKYYEKYSLPINDINNVDVIDFEKVINTFISKCSIKRGKVHIVLFGSDEDMPFHSFDLETTNKRQMSKLLPLEIEDLGDEYFDYTYKTDSIGSIAKVYFLRKTTIEKLSKIKFKGSWELSTLVPGYITYQGMVPENGLVLDINTTKYVIYAFRNGLLDQIETGDIYSSFSLDREENPSPNKKLEYIEEDITQFLNKYNFTNGTEIDLVYVVINDNESQEFIARDTGTVLFDTVKDLREVFELPNTEGSVASNAEIMNYSSISLGLNYLLKDIKKYNFSPERLEIKYKNILTTSLSFSIALAIALPVTSLLVGNQITEVQQEVQSYQSDLNSLSSQVESIEGTISENEGIVSDYNEYVRSLEELNDNNDNFISTVLAYLPDNTPSTVIFDSIRLEKGSKTLILRGTSQSYKDIGSFAIELEEFGTVSINNIEENDLDNETGYPFELELRSN